MTKNFLLFLVSLFSTLFCYAQVIDTDKLYLEALQEYRQENYNKAVELTTTALQVAPGYHDIRILRVRSLFALKQFKETDKDIDLLLKSAAQYEGVKTISLQRLHQLEKNKALDFSERLLQIYGLDPEISIHKARLLLEAGNHEEARELAVKTYDSSGLDYGQRYALLQLLNLTVKDAVQVTGQYISFSEDYPRNDSWYVLSAEYQHNFTNLAVIGRATYSDRSYNSGSLYEIEAYPVLSEKMYGFVNFGISEGKIFPDHRASASIFLNFATSFEVEAGFRSLFYNDNSYLTGIGGLTAYTGKFYLNARAFVGPERHEQFVQNYQFNVRYYLSTPENFIFGRLGSGISPDEPALYTRAQENPSLEAWYLSAGINKTIGLSHVLILSSGLLSEDLLREETGRQFTASLGYRYKF